MPTSKALRLALARAAEHLWNLAAQAQGIRQELLDHEAFMDTVEGGRLYLLLDGPDGHVGAAILDMQAVAALIEVQTMGRVVAGDPPDRPPTHTDAAIAAPLIDRLLRGFARNLADDPDGWWAEGFRFGDRIEDRRALGLMLRGSEYRSFRVTVDFGEGARTGEIVLAFPDRPRPAPEAEEPKEAPETNAARWEPMPAELMAVIARLDRSVSEVAALQPGDLLHIDRAALGRTRLEAGDHRLPVTCELGQSGGMRALRVVLSGAQQAGAGQTGTGQAAPFAAALQASGADDFDGGNFGGGNFGGAGFGGDLGGEEGGLAGLPDLPGLGGADGAMGPGTEGSLAAFAAAEGGPPDLEGLPDLPDLPDLPAFGGASGDGGSEEESLPDLPPLDFETAIAGGEGETGGDLPDLPDLPDLGDLPDLDLPDLELRKAAKG